ncbi:MAG: phosphoribosylformylglycinamidine synthase subunit PurL [Ignavibacteriales bacterium]|nr:phosphoribosylformylglycinamidine synthase subunit PurL [Ignavibacteriales bacterium]
MKSSIEIVEPAVNLQLALEHGLTEEEYEKILDILGRVPTYTELGIYSVMWSEHCSYKNSIAVLKTLPRIGGKLLVEAGEENAGLVDIGDNLAVAFKIESHNHPSAVEPYQGAATGVGGIMRDVFTMGARPVACLNSLRFGDISDARVQYLFKNVVRGIGDYGNSFGVPTVGGEVYFERCYRDNPLVNAMAVGVVKHGEVARAVAAGVGNPVLIVGSATGRDGIHGATFASEEISNRSEAKRPSVQVGDPFTEKLLLEATLEAIKTGYVVGIQDMGAAGLTCSSAEMSARGTVGMDLHLDGIPIRELEMSSYEIMLSESQERMLVIAQHEHEQKVINIFKKWDLPAVVIGHVKDGPLVSVYHNGELKAEVPAPSLVLGEGAPVYIREEREPQYLKRIRSFNPGSLSAPKNYGKILRELLSRPNIGSKRWVYEQYDSMVRTNSVSVAGGDAAVIRIKGTRKAISLSTDCNSRYVYLNPRRGAQIAVAESARNVVCTGASPVGITNCLNFGNPYDPEVYWQFREAVAGIGDACRVLGTPVTGGNVSFYNESPEHAVFPTPVIGMVGLIEDAQLVMTIPFKRSGDVIILIGINKGEIGGSEYLMTRVGDVLGDAPELDLVREKAVDDLCLQLIRQGLIASAHDVSEGGIGVCLAECCISAENGTGAYINESVFSGMRKDFWLFGESQSMVVVSCRKSVAARIEEMAGRANVPLQILGRTTDDGLITIEGSLRESVDELTNAYEKAMTAVMGESASSGLFSSTNTT